MRYSLFILLFPFLMKAQVNDSCLREVGVSMNLVPGLLINTYLSIQDGYFPMKQYGGYYAAYDGYGLNVRNYCRFKLINRYGINYNQGLFVAASKEKFLSGSFYAGHEW